jgi:transposase
MEMLKRLHEAVHRRSPELWPNDWILHHDNAPAHRMLTVKQFLAQESITEVEYPTYSSHLAPNDFCLFPKIKVCLKGAKISGY